MAALSDDTLDRHLVSRVLPFLSQKSIAWKLRNLAVGSRLFRERRFPIPSPVEREKIPSIVGLMEMEKKKRRRRKKASECNNPFDHVPAHKAYPSAVRIVLKEEKRGVEWVAKEYE